MIIPAGPRSTEAEIVQALLEYLPGRAYGEADMRSIFFDLGRFIKLTPGDKEVSRERFNEMKWQTIVRNIGAHTKVKGNPIHDDILVRRKGGGYQLASRVRNHEVTT